MAARRGHAPFERRREATDRSPGWMGKAHGDTSRAPRRAKRAPPGRLEVDRHRRHITLRRLRLQPGGNPHRPGRLAQPPCRESLGRPRVQEPGRQCRNRHAKFTNRTTALASIRPPGRGRRVGSGRHDSLHGAQRRISGSEDAAGTAQPREGIVVSRCGRLDG